MSPDVSHGFGDYDGYDPCAALAGSLMTGGVWGWRSTGSPLTDGLADFHQEVARTSPKLKTKLSNRHVVDKVCLLVFQAETETKDLRVT